MNKNKLKSLGGRELGEKHAWVLMRSELGRGSGELEVAVVVVVVAHLVWQLPAY